MSPVSRRAMLFGPLALAAVGGYGGYALLRGMRAGTYDPRGIPSPLVGKPMPDFTLAAQPGKAGFSRADVLAAGHVVLVNFFASWCVPCVVEAPVLSGLQQQGVDLWGVAYKDKVDATAGFLTQRGDPYQRIGRDQTGTVAIDFGLYGVPETFFIDRGGIIRWRWAGPLSDEVVAEQLQPLMRRYA
jgi:cytochrome c biogenesis protein CcmG/thiol:disulfide interchange protein DsbE